MTSPDYSTTRRLTSEKPACFDTPVDGMQTLLKTPDSEQKIAEGGLRLQGLYKTSSEDKPLITVVTVVYNGAEFLEETINSVIEQTYDNVEYIIVDGGSTDGTLEIIKKYEHAIDYWVSEPDKGIYDAMNKGIDLGSGEWINFMNAGDAFFDKVSVTNLEFIKCLGFDLIYGHHKYPGKGIVRASSLDGLWKGMVFSHQSLFVKLDLHKNNKFVDCYFPSSDFKFIFDCFKKNKSFLAKDLCISNVSSLNTTNKYNYLSNKMRWLSVIKYYPVRSTMYYFPLLASISIKFFLKRALKLK